MTRIGASSDGVDILSFFLNFFQIKITERLNGIESMRSSRAHAMKDRYLIRKLRAMGRPRPTNLLDGILYDLEYLHMHQLSQKPLTSCALESPERDPTAAV